MIFMNNVKNVKVESLNKVGSVKKVNEFTFTLVEKTKFTYMVEVTVEGTDFSRLELVAHNTWKKGVFTKVIRNILKEQKENEENETKGE